MSYWPSELDDNSKASRAEEALHECQLLNAGLRALYTEFDKFSKKNPKDKLTDLALSAVNDAIDDAKRILSGDRYVDRVARFVPAGENPSNGDALLVLSTLRSALDRFQEEWDAYWDEEDLD